LSEEATSNTPATIFLIEEEDDARPHLKRNLRKRGYRVLVAADMEDAPEWMRVTHIPADLMLINLLGKSPEELEGIDEKAGENDWICYHSDAEQLRALILRLTGKDSTRKQ
jgi:DNA-binding NtrC family response regulator